MNKKGFTLTEIIGAIIILGILVIIAVVAVTRNMSGFREDYYNETIRTLTESGKEFFNDNRKYRPKGILEGQVVPISTLVSQKYIDEVKDYQGNSCSTNSYAIVIKNGKDDYTYHACLACPSDNFSNMDDLYCDAAWTNSTTIEYTIEPPPLLYVYKNTAKEELKDLLAVKAAYVKKNAKGEVIGIVYGSGLDDSPLIYPDNIDSVDTSKLGEYPVNYTYQEKTVTGTVIVYEYKQPDRTITKETEYAIGLDGSTLIDVGTYTSGEWTQKIHVSLTAGTVYAGTADLSNSRLKNIVHKYQWNKDGVWQDFCNGDDCTNRLVTIEMNEDIKFRSVDINGVISEETIPITIRIDNTKPTCGLKTEGSHKGTEWFTSNVEVTLTTSDDIIQTSPEAVSGIRRRNLALAGSEIPETSFLSVTHKKDNANIKYIGFVEDNARNFMLCEINFKKDATDPECTTTASPSGWTNGTVTIAGTCSDATSNCVQNISITKSDPTGASGASFSPGTVYDNAGNSKKCDNTTIYIDKTKPWCKVEKSNTYEPNGVTTAITCDNNEGGSKTNCPSGDVNLTSGKTYTVTDVAGNSNTCPVTVTSGTQYMRSTRTVKSCTNYCCGTSYSTESSYYSAADPIPGYDECTASHIGCSGTFSCSCERKEGNGYYYNICSWSCTTSGPSSCTSSKCCGYTDWTTQTSWTNTVLTCNGYASDLCSIDTRTVYY